MTKKGIQLTDESIAILHNIALNNKDWLQTSLRNKIIQCLWESNNQILSISEIYGLLKDKHSLSLIKDQVGQLRTANSIIKIADDQYKLTESSIKKITKNITDYEDTYDKCRNHFTEKAAKIFPTFSLSWEQFSKDVVDKLVISMGARIYTIVASKNFRFEANHVFKKISITISDGDKDKLVSLLESFFNPSLSYIREFIIIKLDAYYSQSFNELDKVSVEKIHNSIKGKKPIKIFLDTNMIFSILHLHENPLNEATDNLISLIQKITPSVNIQLFVCRITIDEAKRVLSHHSNKLNGIVLDKDLLSKLDTDRISGIDRVYFEYRKENEYYSSAKDFFDPYIDNLEEMLVEKNITIFNEDSRLSSRSDVLEDITERYEYLKSRYPDNFKNYEAVKHDVILWSVSNDLISDSAKNQFELGSWIITEDYRFISFDEYKKHTNGFKYNICLQPTTLIQLLQLIIPRSRELEETLISNLKTSLLIDESISRTEEISISVLRLISKYESIGSLSQNIIEKIIINDAIKHKIKKAESEDEQLSIIRDEIVQENIELEKHNKQLEEEVADKEREYSNRLFSMRESHEHEKAQLSKVIRNQNEELAESNKFHFVSKFVYLIPILILITISIIYIVVNKITPINTFSCTLMTFIFLYALFNITIVKQKIEKYLLSDTKYTLIPKVSYFVVSFFILSIVIPWILNDIVTKYSFIEFINWLFM